MTLAAAISLSACTGAKTSTQTKSIIEPTVAPVTETIIEPTVEVETTEDKPIETILVPTEEVEESKITSLEPAFKELLDLYYTSDKTLEEIFNLEDPNSALYSSGLYVKLRNFGLDDETIKKELFNVVTFGLVHPFDDGWKNDLLVGNLNKSINYQSDAIIYYYPLASYVHKYSCSMEHEVVEGRIACETIKNDLYGMNDTVLFSNYVCEYVSSLPEEDPVRIALNRILSSKEDPVTCIMELEYIYELGMVPRCASEEEWALLSHLIATLGERENPFEVYYDLACFTHTLKCDKDHYQNEFGKLECDGYRKGLSH